MDRLNEPGHQPQTVDGRPGAIVLVRHGQPDLSRKGRYNAAGWDDWWARYNESGLVPGQVPPPALLDEARKARHLFASPLRRAMETARLTYEDRPFETDALFAEAPLPAPPLPGWLRLSPDLWGGISRAAWWLGYSGQGESHTLSKERAGHAADRLEAAASDGGHVVLCAHGWFNRMIRGRLVARGWTCTYDGRDNYWSWRRLERAH